MNGRIQALAFLRRWHGRFIFDNPPYGKNEAGAQCVNVSNTFAEQVGIASFPGNARDWANLEHVDCERIENTPSNYPWAGDIVVWGESVVTPEGHTGVALHADPHMLTVVNQNAPDNSLVHAQLWDSYEGVVCWFRPHKFTHGTL